MTFDIKEFLTENKTIINEGRNATVLADTLDELESFLIEAQRQVNRLRNFSGKLIAADSKALQKKIGQLTSAITKAREYATDARKSKYKFDREN